MQYHKSEFETKTIRCRLRPVAIMGLIAPVKINAHHITSHNVPFQDQLPANGHVLGRLLGAAVTITRVMEP